MRAGRTASSAEPRQSPGRRERSGTHSWARASVVLCPSPELHLPPAGDPQSPGGRLGKRGERTGAAGGLGRLRPSPQWPCAQESVPAATSHHEWAARLVFQSLREVKKVDRSCRAPWLDIRNAAGASSAEDTFLKHALPTRGRVNAGPRGLSRVRDERSRPATAASSNGCLRACQASPPRRAAEWHRPSRG